MKIPKGWKLVPVEPDDEMVDAACEASDLYRVDFVRSYDAALAASPTPPAQDNSWQLAVLNECFAIEGCYKESDPAGTLTCLINWHVLNERDHSQAQDDEPVAYIDKHGHFWSLDRVKAELEDGNILALRPVFTRPDTSELRKAAETIEISLRRSGYIGLADHLREALNKEKS